MTQVQFGGYKAAPTAAEFHNDPSLFRGLMGPIGSGKSVACCWEIFRMARLQKPNADGVRKTRFAIIRQTYPELKSTTIKTWQDWFPNHICPLKYDAPITGRMVLPWQDGTVIDMEVVFLALERPEDTKKLLSLELTGGWVNEAREVPYRILEALLGRIGRYPAKRDGGHTRKAVIADTNPPDDDHWWYQLAEESDLPNWRFFRQPSALLKLNDGSYVPNPDAENIEHLTDGHGYYMDQVPGKDPEWISVYLLGQYGTIMDGKPVYGSSFNSQWHVASVPLVPIKSQPVVCGLDFGRTPAAAFLQQMPDGQVRCLDEITTEDMDLREMCRNLLVPLIRDRYKGRRVIVTGDPAGGQRSAHDSRDSYDVLREELDGVVFEIIPCDDKSNRLEPRLDAVKQFLNRNVAGKPGFLLNPDCKTLKKGFMGGYKYRRVSVAGNVERYREEPDKNHYSHVNDALQYGCMMLAGPGLQTAFRQATPTRVAPHRGDAIAGY